MQQTNLWVEYYKHNDPYCSIKHKQTSYKVTYGDLLSCLNHLSITVKANLIDIGAGTLDQFKLVPELQRFNWQIVEPSLSSVSNHKCITQMHGNIYDIPTDEKIEIALMLSVSQYLKEQELAAYVNFLSKKLPNLHTIILSDVIVGKSSQLKDLLVYIANALRYGYLLKGVIHLLKMRFGEYNEMRKNIPLRSYTISQIKKICLDNGFNFEIRKKNFGYNFHRKTIIMTKTIQ